MPRTAAVGLEVFEAGHVFSVGGMLGFNGKSVAALLTHYNNTYGILHILGFQ
jgi:hypothetical protein